MQYAPVLPNAPRATLMLEPGFQMLRKTVRALLQQNEELAVLPLHTKVIHHLFKVPPPLFSCQTPP